MKTEPRRVLSIEESRTWLEQHLPGMTAHKQIGPDMEILQLRGKSPMLRVNDAMLERLPEWAVDARPPAVRNDDLLRYYWHTPVDRVLLVACHDYLCQWMYGPLWHQLGGSEQFPTLEIYCEEMRRKSEMDFQDSAPRLYAMYRWYRVIAPQPMGAE